MRANRTYRMSIYETFAEYEIGQELKAISGWLGRHVDVFDWSEKDIQRKEIKDSAHQQCGLR